MNGPQVAFILGGFALLIPTVVMKHPKAYWLFLLVVSIPFDISKWLSTWLVDPQSSSICTVNPPWVQPPLNSI